ncbi:hypothetical protein [Vulcanisaeta sp. JCM 14467]|uniref:hypothetical protein n=1 Tax=Vulcanisaeta sp. JCM 14467 TaxID=1295370 RepID=UPI0006D287B7|nr:hypothetical protein [Vulcanisaeta sp. JCM 14467]
MSGQPDESGARVVVNDEGYLVELGTGLVLSEYALIEGTELRPARYDPRAFSNTSVYSGAKVLPNPKIVGLIRKFGADMASSVDEFRGVEDAINELVDGAMRVFAKRGFSVHRSQVYRLIGLLMARWREGPSRLLRVLECVLDVGCVSYLGERSIVEEAINEVFGRDWLIRQFIGRAISEWNAQGVFTIDEAYQAYVEVSRMARAAGRNYPTKTLIDLAMTYLILINAGEEDTRNYLSIMGREELLDKLRELILGAQ